MGVRRDTQPFRGSGLAHTMRGRCRGAHPGVGPLMTPQPVPMVHVLPNPQVRTGLGHTLFSCEADGAL